MQEQFGRYVLLERIAVGGMAEIFRAKAPGLGGFEKILAIKRLHPRYSQDAEFIDMLIDEARITAELVHSNIGQIFDLAKVEDHYFIAMEFVDGPDLYRIMKKMRELKRRIPLDAAAYIAMEAAAGLDFAHRKRDRHGNPLNIVHRDVSPQNVLVSFEGEVKLIDFGIAKAAVRAHETEAGIIKGKFYYMSPEQARGEVLDHRTDIFSLGIVLYEMVTGELLYKDDDEITLLSQVRRAEVEPPSLIRPEIPRRLEEIIMRALSRDRSDRYPSAQHFQRDLARFLRQFNSNYSRGNCSKLMQDIYAGTPSADGIGSVNSIRDKSDFGHDRHSLIAAVDFDDDGDRTMQHDSIHDVESDIVELGSDIVQPDSDVFEMGSDVIEFIGDSSAGSEFPAAPQKADATVEVDAMDESMDFFEDAPTRAFERDEPEPEPARQPEPVRQPEPARRRDPDPRLEQTARPDRSHESPRRPAAHAEEPHQRRRNLAPHNEGGGEAIVDFNEQATSVLPDEVQTARPAPPRGRAEEAPPTRDALRPPQEPPMISRERLYIVGGLLFIVLAAYTITTLIVSGGDEPAKQTVVRIKSNTGTNAAAVQATNDAPQSAGQATLDVRSTPAGAKLQVNGVWEFETTPTRIKVNAGEPIKLRIAQQRYRKYESTITLRKGEVRELNIELDPLVGQLQVESLPSNATVFVGGAERGRTPVTLSKVPLDKNLTVRVVKDGFQTYERTIDWADADEGQKLRVMARLEPSREPIATPEPRRKVVKRRRSPRRSARRSASRSRGRSQTSRRRAQPRRDNFDRGGRRDDRGGGRRDDRGGGRASRGGGTGKLTVGTKPWGQIFVDGRLAHPEGPLVGYKLSAGRHRVYVCFQADRSRCTRPKTVVIRPGETTRLNIR